MRILHADHSDHRGAGHHDFADGPAFANGVRRALLWNRSAHAGVLGVVLWGLCSFLRMSKLTQSQKALFLWRSPVSTRK
jgi:hypothetical protein